MQTYFIKTFGCASNHADSERIAAIFEKRGMKLAKSIYKSDVVVINTCMVRESAENRIYGLLNNLGLIKDERQKTKGRKKENEKIILTGCLVGIATRDSTGKMMRRLREKFPMVDEFLPLEEVGFENSPLRSDNKHALVPISNGCNNCCTYCVVPFTRGQEKSRPYEDIINECKSLKVQGYKTVTLLGQNVNSYGADIVQGQRSKDKSQKLLQMKINGKIINPVMVKHLGRQRIPTLFPYLLEEVAKLGFEKVNFMSSNPWDFSDELIEVIKNNKNITREIHLPVQSGDNEILKRMNRWYNRDQFLKLVTNLKFEIRNLKLSTDIIVGFPGETKEQFNNTVDLCKEVEFYKAYISEYSDRPMTAAHKIYPDDVPHVEKKRRWKVLEELINDNGPR